MTENNVEVFLTENIVEVSTVGVQGPRGLGVLHGAGPPMPNVGSEGEFYIDISTNKMYGPKVGNSWGSFVNLGGTYTHIQDVASDTWAINHNMEYYPNIEIVDSAGTAVVGNYQYVNVNTIIATFAFPFAGKAYLS